MGRVTPPHHQGHGHHNIMWITLALIAIINAGTVASIDRVPKRTTQALAVLGVVLAAAALIVELA